MNKLILGSILLLSSVSMAKEKISRTCLETASRGIIQTFKSDEPQSDVRMILGKGFRVVGLTDEAEIYSDMTLTTIHSEKRNQVTVTFENESFFVSAEVQVKPTCKVLNVYMGQNDLE